MAVNLNTKTADELYDIKGTQLYVGQAGVKKSNHNDLTLFVLSPETKVSAVFTKNKFSAAPVQICQQHLKTKNNIRALVINTGNANAGTGQAGRDNALRICKKVSEKINCDISQVLPFSTGVIMEPLPVDKIISALDNVKKSYWDVVALAIMTTDTMPKACSKRIELQGNPIHITGVAKGSGMICPNMATLLSFVATDAKVSQPVLDDLIREVVEESFNSITVDGDTSTNDSFVLMATGEADGKIIEDINSVDYVQFKLALQEVVTELAKSIIRDGEGATKFITIQVNGANTRQEARKVGYSIANSPLVKTAFFASDANLGRILCAIGNSGIEDLDVSQVELFLDDILVSENGGVVSHYKEEYGQKIMAKPEITIQVELNRGQEKATVYTCDLSHDYVTINAEYRT
ncbi:MAG: bifunctional glutamate N-acetyltransferase/amino-acid acetyltransferase ArgJ [Neisseriaceae bacterium]|nr:MAG: bifunctional glutamate N-acetyltransferase/amino-acid acetyltransferase ArgJ [Neisseriaceae bacterium]